jgi:hypothetical protein
MAAKSKKSASTNSTGDLGEILAQLHFSRPLRSGAQLPLFRPSHLGEKYPIVDLIVDVLDDKENSIGFFFVQVKSTTKAAIASKTLPVEIDLKKYNRLAAMPAPTFLVGVDTRAEKVYLVSALKPASKAVSSICKKYDLLDDAVRLALHKEVAAYWKKHKPRANQLTTAFRNER